MAAGALGLFHAEDAPRDANFAAAGEFFSAAISPAFASEAPEPFGGVSILPNVLKGAHQTIVSSDASSAQIRI